MNLYYLLVIPIVICLFSQEFFKKQFQNQRAEHKTLRSVILYSLVLTTASFVALTLLWAVNGFENIIHFPTILFSLGFAVCYVISTIFSLLALSTGPFALTALILSYSLLLPTIFGLIFYSNDRAPSVYVLTGILVMCLSLFLVRSKVGNDTVKITKRWVLFALTAFLTNGGCSIFQTVNNEENARLGITIKPYIFMLWGMFFVFASFVIITVIYLYVTRKSSERKPDMKSLVKHATATGLFNTVSNVLILLLNGIHIPAFILFPLQSVGQLTLVFFVSVLLYKEKYSRSQYIGYFLGMASIVLLNIG